MSTPHVPSADERDELEAQAERRARLRALALDPAYEIPRVWRCDTCGDRSPLSATRCRTCGGMTASEIREGQALVEFAIAAPVMMLILLGVIGVGLFFLAGIQQATGSSTIADWAAANPSAPPADLAAFETSVSSCPVTVVYTAQKVTVTLTCPTIAGKLVPALPNDITTIASAFVASPAPSPSPSPVPS
jgi:hypothetical protein